MNKTELRRTYLAKQKAVSAEHRSRASRQIAASFFDSFDLAGIQFLHAFLTIEKFNEIDTTPIFETVWRDFPTIETLVPRVDLESSEMANLRYSLKTEIVKNSWGIREPVHDQTVESDRVDMVLVPGACFDSHGHRVGYGKGFYDRFLKQCRRDCVKIGLNYFEPVERIDDVHDGDVRVDFVITPERLFTSLSEYP